MAGKIKEMIDNIILDRSKGDPVIAEMTKAKFILKGLNPNKFNKFSVDDPEIIEKVRNIASQLKVNNYNDNLNEINIQSAFSTKSLEEEAVAEIIEQLKNINIKVLVFFASSCFDHSKLSYLLQGAFSGTVIFGCSTAGEIIDEELLKNSIVAMAFSSNIIADVKVEVLEHITENLNVEKAFASFEKYFNESSYTMATTRYLGIVLVDGISMQEERLMDLIGDRTNVYFVGGSAGDDLNFVKTFVCANGRVFTDSAVLVLLKMNDHAEFGIIRTQSFRALDQVLIANKVNLESREVIEFNNQPAISAYADAVGVSVDEAPKYFSSNPVGLLIGDSDIYVRSPRQKKGTSIQFYCYLLEKMEVKLLELTSIIEDTKNSLKEKINEFGWIEGIINFQCIERTIELEKNNLIKQYGQLFRNIPTIGFSTYGEEYIGHMNQTSTMLVFKNKKTEPYNYREFISCQGRQKLKFYEKINENLIMENYYLQNNVLELNRKLEGTTEALKEFNIMLEEEINERNKIEEALKMAWEQLFKVFHSCPYMMVIRRKTDNICIDVNERYLNTMGISRQDIIGQNYIMDGVDANDYDKLKKLLNKQGYIENIELNRQSKRGNLSLILSGLEIEINGEQCILYSFHDVTEMKRIQGEMARLDRLNLIGQMAASIAHEIRNPMTTIRGYLQLLGFKPEFQSYSLTFKTMIDEIDRANSIISEFLSLARNRPAEMKNQNINNILENLYPLLEANAFTQNKQIVLKTEKIPDILLNEKEISQLILNLCRNGLEAMQERGTITIRTYVKGEKVVLSVQDEGEGIPPAYLDKLGTPFFTTKENGTGLGLATCYSIAEQHHAKIEVKSDAQGTIFGVRFPFLNL